MRNKPRIRFKGFTEDWEQHKFNDIVFKQSKISETELPYVEFEDINSGIGTLNKDISQKTGHKKGILFEAGDVLFGKLRPYLQNWLLCEFDGIAVGDFWVLRPQSVTSKFLYYLIQSEAYQSVANISSGTKMPRSNWTLVSETSFSIPKYEESRMIGEFFSFIDKTITLHQRKLEKLKLAKKALLQKLFPKNGSQFPEIRFKGFTDTWEQRKLGDLYKRVNERNDGTLGKDKWISVAKMYFQDPDKVQSNNLDTRTYVMKKGDIAFEGHPNNEFKFGRFVLNDIGTGIISELFPIYRPITEYDLDFWKYAIQLERVMAPIFAKSITSSGNSSNKLDHNHFLNQELLVPNIEEQKKIGSLLSILNKNITLHQRKLDRLQEVKKGLLQKMFV